jgi:hypothetical protein
MNSIRGAAFIAITKYIRWKAIMIERTGNKPTLNDMPEVIPTLVNKMDPDCESSIAVRSVFGNALTLLAFLDEEWVSQNMAKLLHPAGDLRLGQAVWESYLVHSNVNSRTIRMFDHQYRESISSPSNSPHLYTSRDPIEALSEHMMVALWWGLSSLEISTSLVSVFFSNATDDLRAHAILFLERSIRDQKTLDLQVVERLRGLWEARLRRAESGAKKDQQKELEAFAAWSASNWTDEKWRMQMLRRTLKLTNGRTLQTHLIFEELGRACNSLPAIVLECLDLMLLCLNDSDFYFFRGTIPAILQSGFRSSDPAAQENAHKVANFLAERGFHEGTRPISEP